MTARDLQPVPGLSTTFTRDEVEAVTKLFAALQLGRDVRVILRNVALNNARAKFARLKAKADRAGKETT